MTAYDDELAERKARIAAANRRQTDRFAERITAARAVPVQALAIPGTRDFALDRVGPGWQIFSTARRLGRGEDDIEFADRVGGVVAEVLHDRYLDDDEILEATRYRCLATWHPEKPWHTLDAGDVDVAQLAGIDRMGSTTAVRWLLRPIASSRSKVLTTAEIAAVVDAYRLTVAVAS